MRPEMSAPGRIDVMLEMDESWRAERADGRSGGQLPDGQHEESKRGVRRGTHEGTLERARVDRQLAVAPVLGDLEDR